jgi:hypothetical protein
MSDMPGVRFSRLVLVIAGLTILTSACSNGKERASFTGGVEAPAETHIPVTDASTTTTALAARSLVLAPDGLGPLAFGTQAAQALHALTQALGRAENWTVVPAGAACAATRIFSWKNFDVLVNEVTAASGSMRGLVGWRLRGTGPTSLGVKTETGIGIGSTLTAVKAAYGESANIVQGEPSPTLNITTPNGVIAGDLDGLGDANRIQALRAGTDCAV